MILSELLLAYSCLYNVKWCKPHPLIEGSFKKARQQVSSLPCPGTPQEGEKAPCPQGQYCEKKPEEPQGVCMTGCRDFEPCPGGGTPGEEACIYDDYPAKILPG